MPRKRPTPRLQPGLGVGEGGHGEGMGEAGDEALGRDAGVQASSRLLEEGVWGRGCRRHESCLA